VLLIVGGVDAIRATHVTDSASYHQGYARAQRADQNDWPEVRSSGSTATMLCSFAAGFDKPENAGDYVRGCTDGMHARGMRP